MHELKFKTIILLAIFATIFPAKLLAQSEGNAPDQQEFRVILPKGTSDKDGAKLEKLIKHNCDGCDIQKMVVEPNPFDSFPDSQPLQTDNCKLPKHRDDFGVCHD